MASAALNVILDRIGLLPQLLYASWAYEQTGFLRKTEIKRRAILDAPVIIAQGPASETILCCVHSAQEGKTKGI
jgi:hypothetical protein